MPLPSFTKIIDAARAVNKSKQQPARSYCIKAYFFNDDKGKATLTRLMPDSNALQQVQVLYITSDGMLPCTHDEVVEQLQACKRVEDMQAVFGQNVEGSMDNPF
eukprot:45115-Chlamydomonas_euryale.AAC.1